MVDETGQPYVFSNDNPLDLTDPLGAYARANDGSQMRTGYFITVWASSPPEMNGMNSFTYAVGSVTVTGASQNASVSLTLSPSGAAEVKISSKGNNVGIGIPLTSGLPRSYGYLTIASLSGSNQKNQYTVTADISVVTVNIPTSGFWNDVGDALSVVALAFVAVALWPVGTGAVVVGGSIAYA